MRRMATATGARLPVPRQPLNLTGRHFSSITRNPTQAHSHRRFDVVRQDSRLREAMD